MKAQVGHRGLSPAICLLAHSLLTPGADAESLSFCASTYLDGTLDDAQYATQKAARQEVLAAVAADPGKKADAAVRELQRRADSDGSAGGAKSDILKKLFVFLDLGDVAEEDTSLVFNFNPDRLRWVSVGSLSPRVIIRKATVFEPLGKKFDELEDAGGAASKSDLEEELKDLDDVECQIRWSLEGETPSGQVTTRTKKVAELSVKAFEETYLQSRIAEQAESMAELAEKFGSAGLDPEAKLGVLCADSRGIDLVAEAEEQWRSGFMPALEELRAELDRIGYFGGADLVDGEPKLLATASFIKRRGAAGPDKTTASVRYELSRISLRAWQRWSERNGEKQDFQSLDRFVKERKATWKGRLGFAFSADYSEIDDFEFSLPEGVLDFSQEGKREWSAKAALGTSFDADQSGRLDLALAYDDATDDPAKNNRFIGSLTWTQKLSDDLAKLAGGSNLVASLVYANEPEYRGEVNKELSVRAGLKWSFGDKEK